MYLFLHNEIPWVIVHQNQVLVFRHNYTPTRREGAILQSPCPSVSPSIHLSVHPFVCPSVSPSFCLSVRSHFRNRYLSFYWKKWLHIYFLFTVRLTNERVGVFLARRSVQHLVHHELRGEATNTIFHSLCFELTGNYDLPHLKLLY